MVMADKELNKFSTNPEYQVVYDENGHIPKDVDEAFELCSDRFRRLYPTFGFGPMG